MRPHRPILWSYGVTTVPSRKPLLLKTLESLKRAGFDRPHLFVDGGGESQYAELGLEGTFRNPKVHAKLPLFGPAANWVLSAYELYLRQPSSDYYAIFQDDMVACKGLRPYLEKTLSVKDCYYWNLYTFPPDYQSPPPRGNFNGWYDSNQKGRGAVALVFNRQGMMGLLGCRRLVDRPQNAQRGHRVIDGGIVESMKLLEYKERIHHPSLVQHTGDRSSFGNRPHPKAVNWMGEDWDATSLLGGK